ncbi:hypothetical protein [Candidatus Lokiarchaeum ossiferum]
MERSEGKEMGGMREKTDRKTRKRGILEDLPQRSPRKRGGWKFKRMQKEFSPWAGKCQPRSLYRRRCNRLGKSSEKMVSSRVKERSQWEKNTCYFELIYLPALRI